MGLISGVQYVKDAYFRVVSSHPVIRVIVERSEDPPPRMLRSYQSGEKYLTLHPLTGLVLGCSGGGVRLSPPVSVGSGGITRVVLRVTVKLSAKTCNT